MLAEGSDLQEHAARRQGSFKDRSRQPIGHELSSSDALLLVINACQKINSLNFLFVDKYSVRSNT